MSFNFMTAVTIHMDFGAQESKICNDSNFSPSICHEVMGLGAMRHEELKFEKDS